MDFPGALPICQSRRRSFERQVLLFIVVLPLLPTFPSLRLLLHFLMQQTSRGERFASGLRRGESRQSGRCGENGQEEAG